MTATPDSATTPTPDVVARILLVEDDEGARLTISDYLETNHYDVVAVGNAEQALALSKRNPFDIAIVDWVLPQRSGVELCQDLRQAGFTGVIVVLTGKSEVESQIAGHASGADHYWVKPLPLRLMQAKIEAILRGRERRTESNGEFPIAGGLFDDVHATIVFQSKTTELSAKHAGVLKALLLAKGGWVTREDLLARVWRYKSVPNTRTVDNYIVELRKVLRGIFQDTVEIRSKRNLGYALRCTTGNPAESPSGD